MLVLAEKGREAVAYCYNLTAIMGNDLYYRLKPVLRVK